MQVTWLQQQLNRHWCTASHLSHHNRDLQQRRAMVCPAASCNCSPVARMEGFVEEKDVPHLCKSTVKPNNCCLTPPSVFYLISPTLSLPIQEPQPVLGCNHFKGVTCFEKTTLIPTTTLTQN